MADGIPTWEEVARDYGRFLYNVAYRLAGNDDDAQDLVQESLIRVRKGLERYEPGSLEGWLARIVTNVFLDEVRRRKRRPTDALPDDPGRVLPPSPAADEVPTGLSDEVERALVGLPEDFRVPVVLCDVSDLSYEQIAGRDRGAHRHRALAHPPRPAPAARRAHRRRGERAVSGHGDVELVPEMLSAYLDGELSAPERDAVDARLAESAEWRAELDEVRAARDAVRRLPAREAPDGFWDSLLATVASDDDTSEPVEDAAPIVSIESRRPTPPGGVDRRGRGDRRRAGRGDRGAAPQRGHPQRHRRGRAARRAGIRLRRPRQHVGAGRSPGRVPAMSRTRRPSTLAWCTLVVVAVAWPMGAWGAAATEPPEAREAARLVSLARDAASQYDFSGTAVVTWTVGDDTRRSQVEVHDVDGALEIVAADGGAVIDDGRRTYLRDRLGWTGALVEPAAGDLPGPAHRWELSLGTPGIVAGRPTTVVVAARENGTPVQRLFVDDATGLVLRRQVLGPDGHVQRSMQFSTIDIGDGDDGPAMRRSMHRAASTPRRRRRCRRFPTATAGRRRSRATSW